jgi:spore cortex biosynthesis protein YabQ
MQSLTTQVQAFFIVIFAGLFFGALFDSYRVFRGIIRPGTILTPILDLVFWLITTPALFFLLLIGNWGELRFYVFIGLALGLFLYFTVLTHFILTLFLNIATALRGVINLISQIVITVISFPVLLIREIIVTIQDSPLGRRLPWRSSWRRPRLRWPLFRKW